MINDLKNYLLEKQLSQYAHHVDFTHGNKYSSQLCVKMFKRFTQNSYSEIVQTRFLTEYKHIPDQTLFDTLYVFPEEC